MDTPAPFPASVLPDGSAPAADAADALPNPFSEDVCPGPYAVEETLSVPGMNADVLKQLTTSIDERLGGGAGQPLLLLTAPRAGYGKTHLLGRLASAAGGQIVLVPLAFRSEDAITLSSVARRGLEAMARAETGRTGWTRLREACAGVCATLLRRLIASGQLPSANPDQAQRVLAGNPVEIFDVNGSARLIGDWIRRHGMSLKKPLTDLAGQTVAADESTLAAWMSAMLQHAQDGGASSTVPLRTLAADDSQEGAATFLRVLGLWRPVVLMVDHLDAYYRNPDAGLKIAALLLDLAEMDGVHVVMSLNQDVWQATFGHHLPSAMEDRLTSSQLLLRGLGEADAAELLRMRLEIADVTAEQRREFEHFVDVHRYFLGRPLGSVSARGFLRHLARQWEVFQNTTPSPDDAFSGGIIAEEPETAASSLAPVFEAASASEAIPAISESAPYSDERSIFDHETLHRARTMAEGLAEPVAALPQEDEPALSEPAPAPVSTPAAAPATQLSDRSAGAFEKLREMLGKLRQPAAPVAESNGMNPETAAALAAMTTTIVPPPPAPAAVDAPAPVNTPPPPAIAKPVASPERDALLGRFEALRLQMSAEAEALPLDHAKIGELIRLAGKRFPLVRFTEHELPGLTGRQAMVWSLHGLELIFGLAGFAESSYWRTLASFAVGKLAETQAAAAALGESAPKVKLVTFKTDREQQSWTLLKLGDTFPGLVEDILDPVHLDSVSVASLYAMQRIIKESESGSLAATPAQVMSVLARELDFFWKRVTKA